MTTLARSVTGGVDTHLDVHVVAALDEKGTLLGVEAFETTRLGYKKLLAWLCDFGPVALVGIEGSSSYGAGVTRHLHAEGIAVVEVDRPNRQRRRRKGKSDSEDAISAARAAFSGDACGAAKTQDGNVEAMRVIRMARLSARRSRTLALNQMRSLISTAPEPIRDETPAPQRRTPARASRLLSARDQARPGLTEQTDPAHARPSGYRPRGRGQVL